MVDARSITRNNLPVTAMKQQKLQPDEIVELLTPLMDFSMLDQCSVSSLKNDPRSLTKKMKITGAPIRLTHNEMTIAIMCDPSAYIQVEERRRRLVALLENAPSEFIPAVGRRPPLAHPDVQELKRCIAKREGLDRQIYLQKCRLCDLEDELRENAEKERKLVSAIKPACLPTD